MLRDQLDMNVGYEDDTKDDASVVYIGYNLDTLQFRDEQDQPIAESVVRKLWDDCKLDATCMVHRLITQHNWDGQALQAFYTANK